MPGAGGRPPWQEPGLSLAEAKVGAASQDPSTRVGREDGRGEAVGMRRGGNRPLGECEQGRPCPQACPRPFPP